MAQPPTVTTPVPGPDAFRQAGPDAVQSQAAILLAMGMQLRADPGSLEARAAATDEAGEVAVFAEDDLAEFPLPGLNSTTRRFAPLAVRQALPRDFRTGPRALTFEAAVEEAAAGARAELADALYAEPAPETAAMLFEASLTHPDELVRVSAASSYLELSDDPAPLLAILAAGTYSTDTLVWQVAATALGRAAPEHPRLRQLRRAAPSDSDAPASSTALMVHGTFARNGKWWQPGGNFHTFVSGFRPDLYSAADRFDWSGGYSDAARLVGSHDLQAWVAAHGLNGLDLYTHSHGGSISMLASAAGMDIGCLVLTSCPVHVHKYFPDFNHIRRAVVSVRVRMDLVILADRGGQRFRDPRIKEVVLPVWFDHSASHYPNVWQQFGVRNQLPCGG